MNSLVPKEPLDTEVENSINFRTCNIIRYTPTSGYNDVFMVSKVCHKIDTVPEKKRELKQYPVPIKYAQKVKQELHNLAREGIIRRIENGWSSPAFATIKKNGDIRIIVDYRHLNKITMPIMHPCPSIDELLTGLNGAKIFSIIDLAKGYHQIPIHEKYVHKTGFVILKEHYEYLKMPLGLSNAP